MLQRDEWLVGRAYLSAESMQTVLALPEQHSDGEQSQQRRSTNKNKEVAQLQPA